MTISIEAVSANDLPRLASLYEQLAGRTTNMGLMRQSFTWMQSNPDYYVLGAKVGEELAGTLLGIVCRDLVGNCQPFMVVENVIVGNNFRRKGVGKALMLRIEEIAAERDCLYIMFVSSMERRDAHRFYESLGYATDSTQGFKKYL